MKKIKIEICMGTTCFVMGASNLTEIEDILPAEMQAQVELNFCTCLDVCKNGQFGKAPFVKIDDAVVGDMTLVKLIDAIKAAIETPSK